MNCTAIASLFSYSSGASIHSFQCSVSVKNCSFTNGLAKIGGSIAAIESNILIENSIFSNGFAKRSVGGVWILNCNNTKITNCTFSNNQANEYYGAISINNQDSGIITIDNCIISGNTAFLGAGGIGISSNGETILSNITFMNNRITSTNSSIQGNALFLQGPSSGNQIHFVYLSKIMFYNHTQTENNISLLSFYGKVKIIIEDWACADSIYNYIDDSDYGDKIIGNVSDVDHCISAFFPHEIEPSSLPYVEPTKEFTQSGFFSKSIELELPHPDTPSKNSNSATELISPTSYSQIQTNSPSLEEKDKDSLEQNSQEIFDPNGSNQLPSVQKSFSTSIEFKSELTNQKSANFDNESQQDIS
jgi:hypothetical protein